jgi:hypothetical protein
MELSAASTAPSARGQGGAQSGVLGWLLMCMVCAPSATRAAPAELVTLPIVFHVVHVAGQPVVDHSFIAERLAQANAIFQPYGLRFAESPPRVAPAAHAELETRTDRDALAKLVATGAINCFLVRSLRDVDEPPRMRRGVHWRSRAAPAKHFVILSSIAERDVLAHELGHYLGNPEHSEVAGNLMSYERGDGLPVLSSAQARRVERAVCRYIRSNELRIASGKRPRCR